ncbi:MAG: SUMF1/EgtB/PvdO family nonheme iron enzyme [Lachnospiraceae bacterium]|nr:SUMF1/EgtB/PvdO family nonheme iron enzyme [Lachnospiraceae bacterium]
MYHTTKNHQTKAESKKFGISFIVGLIFLSLVLFSDASLAALGNKKQDATENPFASFNPRASSDDIELPMPGGLTMVLRAVSIPAEKPFSDLAFDMGVRKFEDEDATSRSYYEKTRKSYIGAPVTYAELPVSWQKKLPSDEKEGYCYYFIGKYELTNAQWNAVMGGGDSEQPNLPKTNVSWYDIQAFLQKYNAWLMAQKPAVIPVIENSPLFFRLPTEAEWEFAARGGNLPTESYGEKDFVLEEGEDESDYAIFGEKYDKPMPIGTKKANRLGLYDMGGNVEEMVQDNFHYTIVETLPGGALHQRLHGSDGGIVAKGGSFLASDRKEMYSGKRKELPLFNKQLDGKFTPYKARFLGFRLVMSSINISGMRKTGKLNKAVAEMSSNQPKTQNIQPNKPETPKVSEQKSRQKDELVTIKQDGDLLTELDKITNAAASPFMKSNLAQFKELVMVHNRALTMERDANLLNNIRSAVYKIDAFVNIGYRFMTATSQYELAKHLKQLPEGSSFNKDPKIILDIIEQHFKSLEISTNYYRESVREIAAYPKNSVDAKILQLKKQYSGSDKINVNFRNFIDLFATHVDFVRKNGGGGLTNNMVWNSALTPKMLKAIEQRKMQSSRRR